MLDDRVRTVLARLEEDDRRERDEGVARELRARQVAPTTGRFLLSLVAPQTDCEVLELGGPRGYSSIWLAAGVRHLGGRGPSLGDDPAEGGGGGPHIAGAGPGGRGGVRGGGAVPEAPPGGGGVGPLFPPPQEG